MDNIINREVGELFDRIREESGKAFDRIIKSEELKKSLGEINKIIITFKKNNVDLIEEYVEYLFDKYSSERLDFRKKILEILIRNIPTEKVPIIIKNLEDKYPEMFETYYDQKFENFEESDTICIYEEMAKYHPDILGKIEIVFDQHILIFIGLIKGNHLKKAREIYEKFSNKEKNIC